MKKVSYYSVIWYDPVNEDKENHYVGIGEQLGDPYEKEFKTLKSAMNFYNKHRNDEDKAYFWVTKRDEEGFVLMDYVY